MIDKLPDIDLATAFRKVGYLVIENRKKLNEIIKHLNKEHCDDCHGTGIINLAVCQLCKPLYRIERSDNEDDSK